MQVLSFQCSASLEGQKNLLNDGSPLDVRLCEAYGSENVRYENNDTVIISLQIDDSPNMKSDEIAIKTKYFWSIINYFSNS